ncbi:uncharacterized protein K444DRAFT_405166 [Hyaloscypha bicolor E]|uniref:Uncharacterized protein n=1 Tax=Hyaloscypha bicolor E TaxID=1095630 RepID=A0A2J6T908_9HELO|nr:uncharacterized protein K444DRAFT_405166 [Hyaloscypha bicolor E]PMD59514.1 hypothetical protein K444DRAFT_405166 [Hyaloscypha bicolor E]
MVNPCCGLGVSPLLTRQGARRTVPMSGATGGGCACPSPRVSILNFSSFAFFYSNLLTRPLNISYNIIFHPLSKILIVLLSVGLVGPLLTAQL